MSNNSSSLNPSTLTCRTVTPIFQISDGQPHAQNTSMQTICFATSSNSSLPRPNTSEVFTLPDGASGLNGPAEISLFNMLWKHTTTESLSTLVTIPSLTQPPKTTSSCKTMPPSVDFCYLGNCQAPDKVHVICSIWELTT